MRGPGHPLLQGSENGPSLSQPHGEGAAREAWRPMAQHRAVEISRMALSKIRRAETALLPSAASASSLRILMAGLARL